MYSHKVLGADDNITTSILVPSETAHAIIDLSSPDFHIQNVVIINYPAAISVRSALQHTIQSSNFLLSPAIFSIQRKSELLPSPIGQCPGEGPLKIIHFEPSTDVTAVEFSILSHLHLSSIRNCNFKSIFLTPVYCRFAYLNSAQTHWSVPRKQLQLCALNLLINNQAFTVTYLMTLLSSL